MDDTGTIQTTSKEPVLYDFGGMTPHTLVGGVQTTLTARASARADRRNNPREAWRPRGDTQPRPQEAFDRCTGASQGPSVRSTTQGNTPWSHTVYIYGDHDRVNEGVNPSWLVHVGV